jgi:hypothetical protein
MKQTNPLSFTPAQIDFIKTEVFDTLANNFSWPLAETKRKAALALAFQATNYDALLQRLNAAPVVSSALLPLHAIIRRTSLTDDESNLLKNNDTLRALNTSLEVNGYTTTLHITKGVADFVTDRKDDMPTLFNALNGTHTVIYLLDDILFVPRNDVEIVGHANLRKRDLSRLLNSNDFNEYFINTRFGLFTTPELAKIIKKTIEATQERDTHDDLIQILESFISSGDFTLCIPHDENILSEAYPDYSDETLTENNNCLAGMMCPACHSEGGFRIDTLIEGVPWESDGSDVFAGGDSDFTADANCECRACGHKRSIRAFEIK